MDSALDLRSEGRWFEAQSLPSCCFFGQETLPHICLSPPRGINGYRRHTAEGNPAMDWHPFQGGVVILSVTSCYRNWNKLWLVWASLARVRLYLYMTGMRRIHIKVLAASC